MKLRRPNRTIAVHIAASTFYDENYYIMTTAATWSVDNKTARTPWYVQWASYGIKRSAAHDTANGKKLFITTARLE